jgi:hypothetical protein
VIVSKFRRSIGVACVLPLFLAACGSGNDKGIASRTAAGNSAAAASSDSADNVRLAARDSSRKLGAGDVQIANSDTALEIGLYGDTVVAGLGKKVLDKVNGNSDSAKTAKGGNLGSDIERMVRSTVAGALGHQVLIPVSSISDVKYADGSLEFYDTKGKKMHMFESSGSNGHDRSTFAEPDAQRFIAAFKARKAHGT